MPSEFVPVTGPDKPAFCMEHYRPPFPPHIYMHCWYRGSPCMDGSWPDRAYRAHIAKSTDFSDVPDYEHRRYLLCLPCPVDKEGKTEDQRLVEELLEVAELAREFMEQNRSPYIDNPDIVVRRIDAALAKAKGETACT